MKVFIFILVLWLTPVWSAECQDFKFQEAPFTACTAKILEDDIRLFLHDKTGKIFGQFQKLDNFLKEQDLDIIFATNGGMYHADRSPVGMYVENFKEFSPIITRDGPGNFGLLPNGVFCFSKKEFLILETKKFSQGKIQCQYATQSGTFVIYNGKINTKFIKEGTYKFVRSGVGISRDGLKAIFLISNQAVNFHHFASTFLDHFKIDNALYLDGNISRLYSPKINRIDCGFDIGPIVAVVAPAE